MHAAYILVNPHPVQPLSALPGHEIDAHSTAKERCYVIAVITPPLSFLGFLIVTACVMTFEARDNAAKVVPSTGFSAGEEKKRRNAKLKVKKKKKSIMKCGRVSY